MKMTRTLRILMVAALVGVGCDPYDDEPGGTPTLIGGEAADTDLDTVDETIPTAQAADGGAWAFSGLRSGSQYVFHMFANKQLNGDTIQASVSDCTPANGWLTVQQTGAVAVPACPATTPPGPASPIWYSCYSPGSALADRGASVVIYRSCVANSSGWEDAEPLESSTTYTFSGSVSDRSGTALPVNVTVSTEAAPTTFTVTKDGDPEAPGTPGSITITFNRTTAGEAPIDCAVAVNQTGGTGTIFGPAEPVEFVPGDVEHSADIGPDPSVEPPAEPPAMVAGQTATVTVTCPGLTPDPAGSNVVQMTVAAAAP